MLKAIAHAAASRPRVYELIQILAGRQAIGRLIGPFIPIVRGMWLDVGSSSGSFPDITGARAVPVQIDNDVRPLVLAKRRDSRSRVIEADASSLPFRAGAFDLTTCFAVSHHLDDATLRAALREIARVTTDCFVFFDAVWVESRFLSRVLWRYDRGAFPRTREVLERELSRHFEISEQLTHRIAHEYWLAVARPFRRPR